MNSSDQIKNFILQNLSEHQKDIVKTAVKKFGLTRPGILKHMRALIGDGRIEVAGTTKDRTYKLIPLVDYVQTFERSDNIRIDSIIYNELIPLLKNINSNIIDICEFTFSALLNNLMEHSKFQFFNIKILLCNNDLQIHIFDNGIGIFDNIDQKLNLKNKKLSVFRLAEGAIKDSSQCASEGDINLLLYLFDKIIISANEIELSHDNKNQLWSSRNIDKNHGTKFELYLSMDTKIKISEVLKEKSLYNKARVPVNIVSSINENLMSRKQAGYIVDNVPINNEIEFDFAGVNLISPAFADELVKETKNDILDINWINANEAVDSLMSYTINRYK